jgi:MoaA/NifB/PqqE/SkfB family radical SAM enzyme
MVEALQRKARSARRKMREFRMIAHGLRDTSHPVLAHLIPIRRCNLACTYCNEFDDFSDPVPLDELRRRVDHLARLRLSILTISGGEPLLHPELDELIRHARGHGIIASLITNGYLLVEDRIKRLNDAGLEYLQISIDNVQPDDTSKKSLKVLDKKLELLAQHATFHVNINSVVGAAVSNPDDAYRISLRAHELGFTSTVGIIHDGSGQLRALSEHERGIIDKIKALGKRSYSRFDGFQDKIAAGQTNDWRCRAGGRYLYICEDGLVHYCSQQRGYPAIPVADYTVEHVRQAYRTEKPCAPRCTISCVHKISVFDAWRDPQTIKQPAVDAEPLVNMQAAD